MSQGFPPWLRPCSLDDQEDIVETGSRCPSAEIGMKRKASETFFDCVPKLIDKKRKFSEKNLSASQRDQILMEESKQDRESRKELAKAMRESSAAFTGAIGNISKSMNKMATTIGHSMEMLTKAMLASYQPPQQHGIQNQYFQNLVNSQNYGALLSQNPYAMNVTNIENDKT